MEEKKPLWKRIINLLIASVVAVIFSATLGLITASLVYAFLLGWGIVF